jgi:hypothetical protein
MKLTKKQQHFTKVLSELGLLPAHMYEHMEEDGFKVPSGNGIDVLRNARRTFTGDYTDEEQYYYLNIHSKCFKWSNKMIKESTSIKGHTIFESVECKGLGKLLFFNHYYLDILEDTQQGFSLQTVRDLVRTKKWIETI